MLSVRQIQPVATLYRGNQLPTCRCLRVQGRGFHPKYPNSRWHLLSGIWLSFLWDKGFFSHKGGVTLSTARNYITVVFVYLNVSKRRKGAVEVQCKR